MFKVYSEVFNSEEMDKIVTAHQKFKHSSFSIFRPQGTTNFERPKLDNHGNQTNSIQNPHLLGFSNTFSNLIKGALYSNELFECMKDFSNAENLIHYQSMFFDKSTATALHQDSWYLDTYPKGKLFGIWIALEDISEESGPFYLYKNGPDCYIDPRKYKFNNIDEDDNFNNDFKSSEVYKFLPKKGDVVIWDSFNLHGAFKPKNDSFTRKSITGHFYPSGTNVQEQPIKRIFSIYNHKETKNTSHANIKTASTINPYLYNILCLILYLFGNFSNYFTNDDSTDKSLSEIRDINEG